MKHQSLRMYILTRPAKTARDRIWRAVLVGRYPRGFKLLFESSIRGAARGVHLKKISIKIDIIGSLGRKENLFSFRSSLPIIKKEDFA